jgi:type IV secretory pathway VirB2 component (pilin)
MKAFYRSSRAMALAIPMMILASNAYAADTGMPWEAPIDLVVGSISGPVLKGAVTLLIIGAGIAMANSSNAGVQKFASLIFGGSIAGAVLLFLGIFNIGAGALI